MRWLPIGILTLGVVLRWIHPMADPDYYGWYGHYIDEGRWVEYARALAGGHGLQGLAGHNAIVAPAFEIASGVVFWVAGASRFTARFLPLLCGSLILVLAWHTLRQRTTPAGLTLGLAILAFHPELVVLSRLAVPEIPAMLAVLVTFCLLVAEPIDRRRLFLAGIALAATLGLKATTFFLVPLFAAGACLLREGRGTAVDRAKDVGLFLAGLLIPAAVALLGLWAALGQELWKRFDKASDFLAMNALYDVFAIPFEKPGIEPLLVFGLAVWLSSLEMLSGPGAESPADRRFNRVLRIWALGFAGAVLVLAYFPARYMDHGLVPLALLAAMSAGRLERSGLGPLREALAGGGRAAVGAVAVAAPLGIWLAPGVEWVLVELGLPVRFATKLLATGVGMAASSAVFYALRNRRLALPVWIASPVVGSVVWLAGYLLGPERWGFWLTGDAQGTLATWLLGLGVMVSFGLAAALGPPRSMGRLASPSVAAALSAVFVLHVGPGIASPTYTARDASERLGELVAGYGLGPEEHIWQLRADGFFLDNDLPYSLFLYHRWQQDRPRLFVVRWPMEIEADPRDHGYVLLEHYPLHLSKRLRWVTPPGDPEICPEPWAVCFAVFEDARAPVRGAAR